MGTSGQLYWRQIPDFEAPTDSNRDNAYRVTVRASDGSRLAVEALLDVRTVDLIVLIGGETAISPGVRASLGKAEPFGDIKRIAGSSRVDTAARAARLALDEAREQNAVIIVANGRSPPDIGVAAALSARTPGALVVYTAPGVLPAETEELLRLVQPGLVRIIGGTNAIPTAVQNQIVALLPSGGKTQHTSGQTRIHTSVNVARGILPRD